MRKKREPLKYTSADLEDEVTFNLIESIIVEQEKKKSKLVFAEIEVLNAVPKWNSIGLLEQLDESDKFILSLLSEELLNYLTSSYLTFERPLLAQQTIAFPILRRLYVSGKLKRLYKNKDVITIKNKGKKFLPKLVDDISMFYESPEVVSYLNHLQNISCQPITIEAELSALYAEAFTWKYLNRKKYIKFYGYE